jgi:hypothetical protein
LVCQVIVAVVPLVGVATMLLIVGAVMSDALPLLPLGPPLLEATQELPLKV